MRNDGGKTVTIPITGKIQIDQAWAVLSPQHAQAAHQAQAGNGEGSQGPCYRMLDY